PGNLIGDQAYVGRANQLRIYRHAHLPGATRLAHQLEILVGDVDAVELDLGAAVLFQRLIRALAEGIPGPPDGVNFTFRVFREDRPHLVGGVALHVRGDRADGLQLFNLRILLLQFFIRRLTALHRREARDPQLDDIGLAVEIRSEERRVGKKW